MTTLSKLLDALKARSADEHGNEFSRVVEISARIAQQDEQVIRELQHALDSHEHRRAVIHRLAITLANRVGALPPPAQDVSVPSIESEPFDAPQFLAPHPAAQEVDRVLQ